MLLYLDSTIRDIDFTSNDSLVHALENIAIGYGDGHHVVIGRRETILFLSTLTQLDNRPKALYKKIYSSLTENFHFLDYVNVYLKITNGILISKSGKIIETPLSYFNSTRSIQPTNFLCENTDDIRFFAKISSCAIKKNGYKIQLQYNPQMGGGSAMSNVFASLQNSNNICFTIVDSDKYYHDHTIGSTASTLLAVNKTDKPLADIYVLPVREIENLLPAQLISEMISHNREYCDLTTKLEPLLCMEQQQLYNVLKYIDVKKGLTYKNYQENLSRHNIDLLPHCKAIDIACKAVGACPTPGDCTCLLFDGLGDHILNSVITFIDSLSCDNLRRNAHTNMHAIWDEIALQVISWCCASKAIRT
jgi:uncharacterized protein YneR